MILESYQQAKNELLSGNYSVERYFQQNNYILEYAYCKLLTGQIQEAKNEFNKIKNLDDRANWAYKLIHFITNEIISLPTYFQVRNFLEIDINLLLQAKQPQYVENIINGADIFFTVNPESYKFISRVMLNNDFPEVAMHYLKKAKEKFYTDPEMHLMLAICHLKQEEKDFAILSLKNCLTILPNYLPAKKLLKSIIDAN